MLNDHPRSAVEHWVGSRLVSEDWPVSGEPGRSFKMRLRSGFFATYLAGDVILDVGYHGGFADAVPVLPHAIGVDLDYPGYDGKTLPFADASVDAVHSSHMLEHVVDYIGVIRDWYRVLRSGGFIVCIVPHQFLYEKHKAPPSLWNPDHKRFYTPAWLLREFEEALEPNSYRIRHLRDNDADYSYAVGPEQHAGGCYEIELVIEKRDAPGWTLDGDENPSAAGWADAASDRQAAGELRSEHDRLAADAARWFDAAIIAAAEELLSERNTAARRGWKRVTGSFGWKREAFARAEVARAAQRWERAARFYLDALIEQPNRAELWTRLGDMLRLAGRPDEAALAARRATQA